MSLVQKISNFTLADATGFEKLKRDLLILNDASAQTRALFDFGNPYCRNLAATSLANGTAIPNLVDGAIAGSAEGALSLNSKAATFDATDTDAFLPGDAFDLLNYPAATGFLVYVWITGDPSTDATFRNAIAGYAATGTQNQWWFYQNGSTFGVVVKNATLEVAAVNGSPCLLTIRAEVVAGNLDTRYYVNTTSSSVYTASNPVPHFDPTTINPAAVPRAGKGSGANMGNNWKGQLHRLGLVTYDPATFDVPAFIAAEIAQNASRFA